MSLLQDQRTPLCEWDFLEWVRVWEVCLLCVGVCVFTVWVGGWGVMCGLGVMCVWWVGVLRVCVGGGCYVCVSVFCQYISSKMTCLCYVHRYSSSSLSFIFLILQSGVSRCARENFACRWHQVRWTALQQCPTRGRKVTELCHLHGECDSDVCRPYRCVLFESF